MNIDGHIFPSCPICSQDAVSLLLRHANFDNTKIFFCPTCHHWFSYPTPDSLELERYYKESYSRRRSLYFNEKYYALMERRSQAQIGFINKCLQESGFRENYHEWEIVDFGCGIGALVAMLQRSGVKYVIGYDIDPEAVNFGHKRWSANIAIGTLDDLLKRHGQFNLLILSHIIEHLPDIQQTLLKLFQTVKQGGWVFIEVPNCFQEMFTADMDPESHLHFFSRQSLTLLLNHLGASVISCSCCGPPYPQSNQRDVSGLNNIASKLFRFLELQPKRIIQRIQGNTGKVRTIYDGFYDHYPSDENGLWLRCLARISHDPFPSFGGNNLEP